MNGEDDGRWPAREWLNENPWFDSRYHLDQDVAEMGVMREQSAPDSTWRRRVMGVVRRDVGAALLTGWLVVPIWWGLWKVCDAIWGMK